jgi:excisionase family DNA binding protein
VAAHEPEETFLTVAEVAATLKLNQQTVRNWIDAGTLPALRVGRRVRIKQSDFDRILEQSYSGPPPQPEGELSAADAFWGGGSVGLAETDRAGRSHAEGDPEPTADPAPRPRR